MPTSYRLLHQRHLRTKLSGEGARRYGGRFNSPGTAVVYSADSLPLAVLEVLVGLEEDSLRDHTLLELHIPETLIRQIEITIPTPEEKFLRALHGVESTVGESQWQVPGSSIQTTVRGNWRAENPPAGLRELGDQWVDMMIGPVLEVPSAVIPSEFNYIINPNHPDFGQIDVDGPFDPDIDPRLDMLV